MPRGLFSAKGRAALPGIRLSGFGSARSLLAVVVIVCLFGIVGCSNVGSESNAGDEAAPSTVDGPSGLDEANAFLFANQGTTELQSGLGTRPFEVSTDNEETQS